MSIVKVIEVYSNEWLQGGVQWYLVIFLHGLKELIQVGHRVAKCQCVVDEQAYICGLLFIYS